MLKQNNSDNQLHTVAIVFLLITLAIIVRLFVLQVIEHNYYSTFALNTREIFKQLNPQRGHIYWQDSRTKEEYPAAINRQYYLVYAVPKEIPTTDVASTSAKLALLLNLTTDENKNEILQKLSKPNDPYEPIAKKIDDDTITKIKEAKLLGIYYTSQEFRFYPENNLGGNILGFCRIDDNGQTGNYGIEGYWNKILAGKGGFLSGEKSALGSMISLADRTMVAAEDGADILLTIDRTLEYKACSTLKAEMEKNKAKSAALVMMNPVTGAILAMCSLPDFDPNNYSKVENARAYNNTTVFTPYEPGSVFKPITLSIAVDQNLIGPNTTFTDPCKRELDGFTIRNAEDKCYGTATMTEVLENSINTGVIWVQEKLGNKLFRDYTHRFGFGEQTGIEISNETAGNISSLDKKGKIWAAVGSFGQGLTVTPLQLAVAYSTIANQGQMAKPYIVEEIRYANGKREITQPKILDNVISPRAAKLTTGMMVSVIENGHSKGNRLPHYYLAGKTGTAQIPGGGGYTNETNHTFAGFGPANNPKIVLIVKFEAPERLWADTTAGPVFKEIMNFALQYYNIPYER